MMGFLLACWWLVNYYRSYGTLKRIPKRMLSSDAAPDDDVIAMSGGGGAISMGFAATLARMLFMPVRAANAPAAATGKSRARAETTDELRQRTFLATLDQCHLVVVQLAFWILGVGVILGAVWADESWGRPWGWDPKETFALVTWIVYLIVVHVRVATEDKAWWTAVLSIVGFFVMLFNWIGVNFFLVGLHSYA
jgi:ABC-type transport system involved in cytochrome c biogenesis permease subunit